MDYREIDAAVGHRIKALARNNGWDAEQVAQRFVAERIVDIETWSVGFGPLYSLLKGGLLVPHSIRPTGDADMQVARRYSEQELLWAIREIAPTVRGHGVNIVDVRVKLIHVGYGDPVQRVQLTATAGGIRANTHVDISSGFGRDAWPDPRDVFVEEFPSFSPKFPAYKARRQPIESALAEKWLACALQGEKDNRMKHRHDLLLLHSQDDADCRKVAAEILRVCRHRGISSAVFECAAYRMFGRVHIERLPAWNKVNEERHINVDYLAAYCLLGDLWHETLAPHLAAERSKLKTADFVRCVAERKREYLTPANAEPPSNVIAFRR